MKKTLLLVRPVFAVMAVLVFILMFVVGSFIAVVYRRRLHRRLVGSCRHFLHRTLQDLVKFSPVEPDTPALRTEIDFHTLSFRDLQGYTTDGTVHNLFSFLFIPLLLLMRVAMSVNTPKDGYVPQRAEFVLNFKE
jgi:hypothetical protein